jgi:hypothetical protein
MSKVCQIVSQLIVLVGMVGLVITGFSTVASADTEVNAAVVVVSDDIMDRTTDIARPGDGAGPAAAGGGGDDGSGESNNGNNEDGVDSSNPGEGDGGPNGAVDESGSVDDEAGGGGASPSQL